MIKKNFIGDDSGVSLLKTFLIVFVIVAIICLLWYIWSISEITCSPEDQAELTGPFMGYYPSQNYSGFTIVVIGNDTYFFQRGIDPTYLNNLIGFDVSFRCCKREGNSPYRPKIYFDLVSAVIVME